VRSNGHLHQQALIFALALALLAGCSDPETSRPAEAGADLLTDGLVPADGARGGLYLRGATVITATGAPARSGLAVLVQGGRITAIEAEGSAPDGAETLDLAGLTLLPGLIDSHVHIATAPGPPVVALDLFLDFGVTAVKDVGSPLGAILTLRERVARGRLDGPRIVAAGPMLNPTGGHPSATLFVGDQEMIDSATRAVDDPATARGVVRALHRQGVDQIKCMLTSCAGWGSCTRMRSDVFAAIVDEAHGHELKVVVHTDAPQDVREAVTLGADGVEHGVTFGVLDRGLARQIAQSGTVYVPTVVVASNYSPEPLSSFIERLTLLRKAGARVVVGTDAENPAAVWGVTLHQELQHMVTAGYTAMEALIAATRHGAEHLGIAEQVGTIEVGKQADLIAVAGDPLADVAALADVRLVLRSGRIVRSRRHVDGGL
jgi:imidazolonepropionase-like amidohydrolase